LQSEAGNAQPLYVSWLRVAYCRSLLCARRKAQRNQAESPAEVLIPEVIEQDGPFRTSRTLPRMLAPAGLALRVCRRVPEDTPV
jgi:hypothetical protein